MAEFDPYLKWLGIRDAARPINHYRLLGLDLFEADPEVISMAADRQMSHVRTYQNGPHGELSQELLNELARARRCLLTPEQKASYDAALRQESAETAIPVARPVTSHSTSSHEPPAKVESLVNVKSDARARMKAGKRERSQLVWTVVSWISGGLAALGVMAYLIGSGIIPLGRGGDPAVAQNDADIPDADTPKPPAEVPSPTPGPETVDPLPGTPPAVPPEGPSDTPPSKPPTPVAEGPLRPDDAPPARPQPGPILPASTEWTLGNSSTYPPGDELTLTLLAQRGATAIDQRAHLPASNPVADQTRLTDQPDPPGLLIGVRVWVQPDLTLAGIQAIYLRPDGLIAGTRLGAETRHYTDLIAQPGFAVGGWQVSVLDPVHSLQVHFDRITADGLDRQQRYSSPWLGNRVGPVQTSDCPPGQILLGLQAGVHQDRLVSLGLIHSGTGNPDLAMSKPVLDPFAPDAPGPDMGLDPAMVDPAAPRKPAIPAEREYGKALPGFLQAFQRDLDRAARLRSPDQRLFILNDVGRQMRDAAEQATDPVERYVAWHQTAGLFAQIGNAASAISALEQIHQEFDIQFWQEVDNLLAQTLPNLGDQPRQTPRDFMATVDRLIDQATEEQEYAAAQRLIGGALTLANQAGDAALRAAYQRRLEDTEERAQLKQDYEEAELALSSNSDDAKAHSVVGDYLLVMEEDSLESVLEHWSRGSVSSQESLAKLAAETDSADGEAVIKLAKAWQRLGKGKRTLKRQRALQIARDLYARAAGLVDERTREKLEATILEIEAELAP